MKVAIVTGASKGLGKALAEGLAERGWSLVIDARGADDLRAAEEDLRSRAAGRMRRSSRSPATSRRPVTEPSSSKPPDDLGAWICS